MIHGPYSLIDLSGFGFRQERRRMPVIFEKENAFPSSSSPPLVRSPPFAVTQVVFIAHGRPIPKHSRTKALLAPPSANRHERLKALFLKKTRALLTHSRPSRFVESYKTTNLVLPSSLWISSLFFSSSAFYLAKLSCSGIETI